MASTIKQKWQKGNKINIIKNATSALHKSCYKHHRAFKTLLIFEYDAPSDLNEVFDFGFSVFFVPH